MDYRNIVRTNYKVGDFVSWQRNYSLILSPSFQRRPVWPKVSKSYLVDTIVRGYPIPIIFLRERTDLRSLEPEREVVDGQQRLRTLFSFIEPRLLADYDPTRDEFTVNKSHNPDIAGKSFTELDTTIRRRILDYQFSVHILPSDTEDREVLQIFARMNSTGVKLNQQELRNAEFIGSFKRTAYNLAYEQLNRWRAWSVFSENDIARMIEVEETSDLLRTMLEGVHGLSQPALDKLYRQYEDEFPDEAEVSQRFRNVMERIDERVGRLIAGSVFSRRVLFHTLFTFFYDLLYGLKSPLTKIRQNNLPKEINDVILDASNRIENERLPENLTKVLRGGTGNLESRKLRLDYLRGVLRRAQA